MPRVQGAHIDSGVPDYELYDYASEWRRRSVEDVAEKVIIAKWLKPSQCCLDLGGGFGRITQILEPFFNSVFMMDYSERHLASAARRLKKTGLVRGDIRCLPFRDSSLDYVIAVRVLHHIEDIPNIMAEIVRVGRHGATLILGVPNTRLGKYRGIRANQRVLIGPKKHRAFVHPLSAYAHQSLELVERRGVGLFENVIGRRFRLRAFSFLDVVTSGFWSTKPELFMKFTIRK